MENAARSTVKPNRSTSGRRARQACVPCRLSKVKCDGKEPCSRCEERNLMCVLGVDRRAAPKRKSSQPKHTEQGSSQENRQLDPSIPKEHSKLLREEVHCSISGAEAAASTAMHLHYGPSSTFVFIQQLHRLLVGDLGSKGVTTNGRSVNYTAEAVSDFGYSSIFFGRHADPDSESATQETRVNVLSRMPNVESLPFDLAATFLEMYLSSLHYAVPFCPQPTLRTLFYNWYSTQHSSKNTRSSDSTLIIAVLAVGATLTDHVAWADCLFLRARTNLDSWGDAVNLRSVQILILLSEFHSICGRPNSAKLAIGSAAIKALAVGLHHDIPISEPYQPKEIMEVDRSRTQERQSTFWVLYTRDRNLSLLIGRPVSISDLDVDIPDPTGDRDLEAMVALSRISFKIYYGIYGRKKGSVEDFCRRLQGICDELLQFHESLAPEIRLSPNRLDLEVSTQGITTAQMIKAFDFFQTMIVALRPCLVLSAVHRRNATNTIDPAPAIPAAWVSWLHSTSKLCTKFAMHIIYLFAGTIDHNPLISRLRHSRFFLEGTCFVLLFDILRDPTSDDCERNFHAVAQGIECFARLPIDRLILISTSAITSFLQLTRDLVAKHKSTSGQHQLSKGPSHLAPDEMEASRHSEQRLAEIPPLNTSLSMDQGLSNAPGGDSVAESNENTNFFDNDFFDLSYYLWTEDGTPNNFVW